NVAHKPPLGGFDQNRASDFCSAHSVTLGQVSGFGTANKRLLRNKEWKAAAAWPLNLDYTGSANIHEHIKKLEYSYGVGGCNTTSAHGGILTDRSAVGPLAFFSGSKTATNLRQSRYGLQDMVGNLAEWVSDRLSGCSAAGTTCVGITSPLDA